jgi:hypothetical protein
MKRAMNKHRFINRAIKIANHQKKLAAPPQIAA